ncbi:BlaI/MecI/CopY family transcriptional regulator (plasmid) [Arthrobacter sp. YA7-1]|uniref:BlaI/MecI/CopY family transcriptional regulator n=1 Tax=Arthrobacter sp. YA7-1 TaxID=2987701 RepID=UPI002226B148|nr:BlaI/MecI/CopY family transcriptional regulator [Arthrobacter sp. YA7-1]UYY83629.1 BlaI/MecI/CopY family transcriptional regulator [Arthrobacter sp. YA7-1]
MSERRMRGELEASVMRILWDSAVPLSVRDIQGGFGAGPGPAVTTLLTVLERLRLKGQVRRGEAVGGVRYYSAAESESGIVSRAMLNALTESSDRAAALLNFAGDLGEDDVDLLRRALGRRGRAEGNRGE